MWNHTKFRRIINFRSRDANIKTVRFLLAHWIGKSQRDRAGNGLRDVLPRQVRLPEGGTQARASSCQNAWFGTFLHLFGTCSRHVGHFDHLFRTFLAPVVDGSVSVQTRKIVIRVNIGKRV